MHTLVVVLSLSCVSLSFFLSLIDSSVKQFLHFFLVFDYVIQNERDKLYSRELASGGALLD